MYAFAMYVCMHVFVYVCMHVFVYVCMFVHDVYVCVRGVSGSSIPFLSSLDYRDPVCVYIYVCLCTLCVREQYSVTGFF